jgi:general stress protein 26
VKKELKNEITALVDNAKIVYVSSINDSFPNTKAMLAMQHEGMVTHYFSTNLSSKRVGQFSNNPNACIYYCNETNFMGLMLIGKMEVCTDRMHRELLWREGFEMYYPNGIDDEDYCVLKFTALKGNYYHGLSNISFVMEELDVTC